MLTNGFLLHSHHHQSSLRHKTGIYPQVTGTRHFGKRAYPDLQVFSPVGIIGGYPGKAIPMLRLMAADDESGGESHGNVGLAELGMLTVVD